jgi:hypothetical protein
MFRNRARGHGYRHGLVELVTATARKVLSNAPTWFRLAPIRSLTVVDVWARVKEAENALGDVLVETRVGGSGTQRNFLTERARRLITAFSNLRSALFAIVEVEFARRFPAAHGGAPP